MAPHMKSAEILQLVWFTASQTSLKAADVYRSFIGEDPDGSQINRNVNPADPVLSTANGVLDDGYAEMQIRPGRADFLLRPTSQNQDGKTVPTMDLDNAIKSLLSKSSNIYKVVPETTRISIVARLLEKTETAEDAAKSILKNIGLDISAPDLSDAVFQINSRIAISENIKLNRIIKFESASVQTYAVNVGQSTQGIMPIIQEQNYLALQLDINTVPLPSPLTENQLNSAFGSIVEQIINLATSASPRGLEK